MSVTLAVSVSGQNILATAREAGADISVAVNKCVGSTSKERQTEQDIYWAIIHLLTELLESRVHSWCPLTRLHFEQLKVVCLYIIFKFFTKKLGIVLCDKRRPSFQNYMGKA